MSGFTVTQNGSRTTISFDDGGMNLLSTAALVELAERLTVAGGLLRKGPHASAHVNPESGRSSDARDEPHRPPLTAHRQPLLVFRSTRPNLFAAGADMNEMQRFGAHDAEEFARRGQELFAAIGRLPYVTVALIDGDCFGGALDLALAFDLRFATARSRFSHPGSRLGIVTGFGGTSRWRKLLDRAAARQLFLGNHVLSAAEALAAGIVDRVGESFDGELLRLESLDPRLTRFVKDLAPRAERLTESHIRDLARHLGALYGIESDSREEE
jgi:enoyl-CoA hydratase/carnithine racemase